MVVLPVVLILLLLLLFLPTLSRRSFFRFFFGFGFCFFLCAASFAASVLIYVLLYVLLRLCYYYLVVELRVDRQHAANSRGCLVVPLSSCNNTTYKSSHNLLLMLMLRPSMTPLANHQPA